MSSVYRHIIKDSYKITKNNRWLWFLGLFAAVLGNGGIFNILIKNISFIQDEGTLTTQIEQMFTLGTIGVLWQTVAEMLSNLNIVSVAVILIILAISLFILWLAIVTQGGLITGISRIYRGQPASFKESWCRGKNLFWRILSLNITTKVVVYLLLAILSLPFLSLYITTQNIVWQWVVLIVSFMILIPLAILVSLIVQYSIIFVVSKNSDFFKSLKEGWILFKNNALVSIEMAIILFAINVLVALGLLTGLMFILIPSFVLGFLGVYFSIDLLFNLALIVGLIVLIVTVFLVGAWLAVFQASVWVNLFIKMTEGTVIPKIIRLTNKLHK